MGNGIMAGASRRLPAALRCRYFLAITATFIDAGNECMVGGLNPACASRRPTTPPDAPAPMIRTSAGSVAIDSSSDQ